MKQLVILFLLFIVQIVVAQEVYNRMDENGMKQGYWVYLGKDRPETGIPPDGKVEEGNYIDDKKEGVWTKYHDNGITPKLKVEYKNNRPNGYFTKYYANGKLRECGYFVRNQYVDTLQRFFENGNLELFATYDSVGNENGTIRKYNVDGSLNCEYEAVHGTIQNAPACAPIHAASKITPEIEVRPVYMSISGDSVGGPVNDRPDARWKESGPFKLCYTDHNIWQGGTFRYGKLWDGKEYVYDEEGILLKVKIYKNGVYHSDGQL